MAARIFMLQLKSALRQRPVRVVGLSAAMGALLTIAIVLLYWWPLMRDYAQTATLAAQARRQVAAATDAQALAHQFRAAGPRVDRLEAKLDTEGGQAALVHNLAQLATRHRLKTISETYEAGKSRDGYVPLKLSLGMQGPYVGARGFLTQLHTLPQWVTVQEAILDRAESGEIKIQLRLISYRREGGT